MTVTILTLLSGLIPLAIAIVKAFNDYAARKQNVKQANFELGVSELHIARDRMQLQADKQKHTGL